MKNSNLKKMSLEDLKNKFSAQEKENLLEELAGGTLGACHCGPGESPDCAPYDCW